MKNEIKKTKKAVTVTIGIPAFNEENNIENLLKQLLLQKQKDFVIEKIIVASDGSTDNTVKIVNKYVDRGVEVIDGRSNKGHTYRYNEIISKTFSDILVLLNADILLGNKNTINNLLLPIVKGADLSAQYAKPLPPQTFVERILCSGFDFKYFVYTHVKNGDNLYTCIGHMRAFSKRVYKKLIFPTVSAGEDQYIYLLCVNNGFKYRHAKKVIAYFRLPATFKDYQKYARRIFQTQKKFENIFDEEFLYEQRHLPILTLFYGAIYSLLKNPFYLSLYLLLHILIQRWALRQPFISTNVYEVSTSTKILNNNVLFQYS